MFFLRQAILGVAQVIPKLKGLTSNKEVVGTSPDWITFDMLFLWANNYMYPYCLSTGRKFSGVFRKAQACVTMKLR